MLQAPTQTNMGTHVCHLLITFIYLLFLHLNKEV